MTNSIVYVNYAPYGNAGHILDYLLKAFDDVVYCSFVFHPVEKHSTVRIYRQGTMVKSFFVPTLLVPKKQVHYFAPLLSFIAAIELFLVSVYVSLKFKIKPQIFMAPNAFLVFLGIILRAFFLVDKVVFWVWDFYPIPRRGFYKIFFFKLYWWLDKACTRGADFLWYINERLLCLRQEIRLENKTAGNHCIVPLGMKLFSEKDSPETRRKILGFVGMLKKSQGVELIFDALPKLVEIVPDIQIEIIGTGPDQDYFKKLAGQKAPVQRVDFKGFIESEFEMRKIVSSWGAAVAPYVPGEGNLSAYADPSKVKVYLECAVPVIMTKVPLIAEEIEKKRAGIIIEYNKEALVRAAGKIFAENAVYRENCARMASTYDYVALYDSAFNKIRTKVIGGN